VPGAGQRAAVAEIPFLCHFERAAILMDEPPYTEIGTYCRRSGADRKTVFRTLSYFDCMNLASYIKTPTLVTVGLMDAICPPSTVFAAYNHIQAEEKDIIVDYFGEHDTFEGVPEARVRWFARHL
jgi:cephalosporin-C deacetylase